MIKVHNLSKKYGSTVAVDQISFELQPGKVTGFLGPNGSGKSTTMRLIAGLDKPSSGNVLIDGKSIAKFAKPMSEIGVLLDADYVHPTRKAKTHLWALAASNGISKKRVDEVLALVGMTEVANKRVGKFSLGMKQRIGLASALLGNPKVIMLDEPANGLDPEGIRWIRQFLSHLAEQGRTVFVSSHLLSEMALMADEVIVIGKGKILQQTTVDEIKAKAKGGYVLVRTPNPESFSDVANKNNLTTTFDNGFFRVESKLAADIGKLAFQHNIEIHELYNVEPTLEEAYMQLTESSVEYRTSTEEGN